MPKINPNWFDRLPPDVQQEISGLRDRLRRGELDTSARRLGTVISQVLKERGLPSASEGVTRAWLTKSDER